MNKIAFLTLTMNLMGWVTVALAQPVIDPMELLVSTQTTYAGVGSYTATLIRDETGEGKPETISLKFRKPFDVYMKWVKNPFLGRELLYSEGKNDDKVTIKLTGFLGKLFPVVKITTEETSKRGKRGIKEAGVGNMIDRILKQTVAAHANGDTELYYRGLKQVNGRQVHEVERILPQKNEYQVHRLVVHIDQSLNLPVEVFSYDWENKLMEHYTYQNMDVKAKFTDVDFKASNAEYNFE